MPIWQLTFISKRSPRRHSGANVLSHTHTHIYIYIYRERERESEREREFFARRNTGGCKTTGGFLTKPPVVGQTDRCLQGHTEGMSSATCKLFDFNRNTVQGGILADCDRIDTHILKWNPAKFSYPKSLHIQATRDLAIPSKLRFDAIYPSVAILASRQFRAAYWLITTKTLAVGWTLLTQSFSFLKHREIMYHSFYMWKSCSEPTP